MKKKTHLFTSLVFAILSISALAEYGGNSPYFDYDTVEGDLHISCLAFKLKDDGHLTAMCNANGEGSMRHVTGDLDDFIANDDQSSNSLKWDSNNTGFTDSCVGSLTLEFKTDGVWLKAQNCSYDSGESYNKSINLSSGLKYEKDSYDFYRKE